MPTAANSFSKVFREGAFLPFSYWEISALSTPEASASCFWFHPRSARRNGTTTLISSAGPGLDMTPSMKEFSSSGNLQGLWGPPGGGGGGSSVQKDGIMFSGKAPGPIFVPASLETPEWLATHLAADNWSRLRESRSESREQGSGFDGSSGILLPSRGDVKAARPMPRGRVVGFRTVVSASGDAPRGSPWASLHWGLGLRIPLLSLF